MLKKTLMAMASTTLAGTALAQSNVTLYGIVDVSVGNTTGGNFAVNGGKTATGDRASYHTPTRIGLKGSEDLGGGMKANFGLESNGINMGSGALPGNFWGRGAWVGLAGSFGELRLGRDSSVATKGQARFDLNGISTSSALDNAGLSPVTWYGSSRRDAQIQYMTTNLSGFDAGLGIVLGGNNAGQQSTTVRLNYGAGPLAVGYVAETKRAAANRTAQALAGSYDLGMAKVVAGYVVRETAAAGKGAYIGASAPVTSRDTVGFQYASNSTTKVKATELFANHALSKRTSLYLDYVHLSGNPAKTYSYGVGVLHTF